ncbi:MAG TPA: hypothetical protein VEL47_08365 [Myxococcota bacterium]|nr:hypothetical protein [Myxococcota bacterium]
MEPDLKKFIHDQADFSAYLPSQSDKVINQVITFQKAIHDIFFGFRAAYNLLNRELHNYEPEKGEEEKFDSANLVVAGFGYPHKNIEIEKLFTQALRASEGHDVLIPIAITLNSTDTILHAVSMLIRRSASGFNYIFMDPLNWKFSGHQNYQKIIDSIRRLVENPQYFKEALIRSGFFAAKRFSGQAGVTALALFSYVELLENLNLLDDGFFIKVYKTSACELIKNLGETPIQISLKLDDEGLQKRVVPDARQELDNRFKCHRQLSSR